MSGSRKKHCHILVAQMRHSNEEACTDWCSGIRRAVWLRAVEKNNSSSNEVGIKRDASQAECRRKYQDNKHKTAENAFHGAPFSKSRHFCPVSPTWKSI